MPSPSLPSDHLRRHEQDRRPGRAVRRGIRRAAAAGLLLALLGPVAPTPTWAEPSDASQLPAGAGTPGTPGASRGPASAVAAQGPPVAPRLTRLPIPHVPADKAGAVSASGDRVTAATTRVGIPFDVAGVTFTGAAPAGMSIELRTRTTHGWGAWLPVDVDSEDGPDRGSREARRQTAGSAAVTAAGSDGIDVRVSTRGGVVPPDLTLSVVDGGSAPGDAMLAPQVPADSPAVDGSAPATAPASLATATASVSAPAIVSRSAWGADERLMPCQPDPLAGFKAAVVHHTVNVNTYTSAEAPALMRSIFAFHTQSRGWCDIGYNFLVDRFGRIYEGRKGGLSGFTQGAQAGGFNQETLGVSVIGDFTSVPFPSAVRTAVARVVSWQADRSAFDPASSVTLTSAGSTRYAAGVRVTKPRVMGHRDLSLTSCPGDAAYPQVPGIGSAAATQWRAGQYAGRPGRYTPVAARRFVDTRSGLGAPRAPLAAGGTITIRPSGLPSDVTAVTLNLTTTAATRITSVAVFPAGLAPRSSSVLNTGPGRTTAAAVTVGVGAGGAITLRNGGGNVHVIADLAGYYSTGSSSGLVGSFRRVLDTRSGLGAPAQRVEPSRPLTLTVPNLPAGTRAVNLNLTVTRTQGSGYLTAYAGGSARPSTSNLNFVEGQNVANLATVPVGPGGTVTIHTTAPTDVVADVAGVFVAGSGSRFTPVSPRRVLDTRYGWGTRYGSLGGGRSLAVSVAGIPGSASGVAMSLSATGATLPTALTVYATGSPRPVTSNVNVTPGQAISGLAVSGIRSSSVSVSSTSGSVAVIGDLMGYYGG